MVGCHLAARGFYQSMRYSQTAIGKNRGDEIEGLCINVGADSGPLPFPQRFSLFFMLTHPSTIPLLAMRYRGETGSLYGGDDDDDNDSFACFK